MQPPCFRVLLVEDNPGDALLLSDALAQSASTAFEVEHVERLADARARLGTAAYDAVLLDLSLPDSDGVATVAAVQPLAGAAPVLVLTGLDDEALALAAVQAGATDYLVKGQVFGTMLARAVRQAVERSRAEHSLRVAEERFRELADHLSKVFWLRAADGGEVLFVNPAYETVTGRGVASLYADPGSYLRAVHPDDLALAAAPAHDGAWDREYRLLRPGGEVRRVRDRGRVVRGPDGGAVRLAGFLEDVTEARHAQEQIQLQATLLGAVGEAVIATRLDGTIFHWNRAAERMLGWRADEVVGRNVVEVTVPPEALDRGAEIMACLQRGETWSGEFPVLRRDGSVIPALVTDAPINDAEGRLIGIIGTSVDLTEQKRAEAQARESDLRYRHLFATMAQGVLLVDGMRVVGANQAAEDILGIPLAQILEQPADSPGWQLLHEDATPLAPDEYPSLVALRTGRDVDGTVVGVRNPREEGLRWLLVNARPQFRPGESRAFQVFTTFTDITRLRETEEALRRTAQELDAIVGTTPLATVVVDMDRRVRLWNAAAERIFGWTAAETLGQPYPLRPVGDTPAPESLFAAAFGGSPVLGDEIRRVARDGRALDLCVWNAPLRDGEGNLRGLIAVLADITERKALEAQLEQSQKMEAVGLLAGGVAHDFNNILTAIQGFTDLLLADEREGSARHADLLEIRRATTRASDLTRQLLAFGRKQVLRPAVIDLNATVAELEKILGRVLGEDVELVIEPGRALAPVRADRGQVEQVLVNLAVNARDAMPTGGVLRIETRTVVLAPENTLRHPQPVPPGRYVRVSVADTGTGMPPEVVARIFEPFFTTKEVGRGTGLGLSTVYGIVKQSGGYVWAESEPGKGTTFRIYLPAVDAAAEPAAAPEREEPAAPGAETVLVVEDDEAVRELAARVLRGRGYRVLQAADGAEALAVLAGGRKVDLVLSDVVMPRMSGPELARVAAAGGTLPPVLFMSGYPDHMLVRHSAVGAEIHLIEKPFTPEQLARRIRALLDRARHA
jgi:two-component system, cell cycle sensor histidine kinase and response regulator CckA